MIMTNKAMKRICVLAGITILATVASAMPTQDAKITIDRALNSPTVTVRYAGASAALVELRLNGESVGTRSVSASKTAGETNFNINLTDLKDGDNEVEIRLFDRAGKLISSEKTNIQTDQTQYGPVFLSTPKVGESVMGSVDIKLGFGRDFRNVYVSFFVDNNFKKMTNFPPYAYKWDTTSETNGWHEVEAWAVDESSNTYKTRKTRIFVNNPGGRTDRRNVNTALKTSSNPNTTAVSGAEVGIRTSKASAKMADRGSEGVAPKVTVAAKRNVAKSVGAPVGFKGVGNSESIISGTKSLAPVTASRPAKKAVAVGTAKTLRVASNKATVIATPKVTVSTAAISGRLPISKGVRMPNLTSFAVVYNSSFVDFDVNPRVDDGIPMTPFRHLIEKAGGTVDWANLTKTVTAKTEGKDILLQIGDKTAKINSLSVTLETAPYIDRGRTIVPLSFMSDALNVSIEFDKETGHVLITSKK